MSTSVDILLVKLSTLVYTRKMVEVIQSPVFLAWLDALRDMRVQVRVAARIKRMGEGNLGDVKPVGEGVSESRIDVGPGYRLYFIKRGTTVIVLLCGGDKSSQARDIKNAKTLAKDWR
jgi:putative addiction module killer protein